MVYRRVMRSVTSVCIYHIFMCKPWIWTIHGLLAQSIDQAKQKAQSMDLDNPVIRTYALWLAVWVSRSCRHEAIDFCSFSDRKVRKIYCLKDGCSFMLVQTVVLSWLEIQPQHNFNVAAKAMSLIWAHNLASALCDCTHFIRPNFNI